MRKTALAILGLLLAGTIANAQMKPQATPPPSPLVVSGAQSSAAPQFPRISQADAFKLFSEGKATFIDVRSNEQFTLGHIKGAVNIPRSQVLGRFNEIVPGKTVITYCACGAEEASGVAASSLISHGVKNVFALKGGWKEWKSSGHPFAAGPK
jgi:rhodanese-related sulfurtransferase